MTVTVEQCQACKRRMYLVVIAIAVLAGLGADQVGQWLAYLI